MNKLVVLAAFALGTVMSQQVLACEWNKEAAAAQIVACDDNGCAPVQAPAQQAADCTGTNCPAPPSTAANGTDQPANAASSTTVALQRE